MIIDWKLKVVGSFIGSLSHLFQALSSSQNPLLLIPIPFLLLLLLLVLRLRLNQL